jgi:hypothetical protein
MKSHQKLRILFIGFFSVLCLVLTATYTSAAPTIITVKVKCEQPKAGTYSLGWGTSQLIVPETGTPYTEFRGKEYPMVNGKLCKSNDNSGAVFLKNDGTVQGYVRSN